MSLSHHQAELAYDMIAKANGTGPAILRHANRVREQDRGQFLIHALQHLMSFQNQQDAFVRLPVDVQTFIEGPEFLDLGGTTYPAVMDVLREINSGKFDEAILTGGIGTGKTTIALLTTAYQLHVLACLRSPARFYGLDAASEILVALQSISGEVSKNVTYSRLREMIDRSPFFQNHFRCNPRIKAQLEFPNGIFVRPLSSKPTAAIGSNVIAGIIDEVNFFDTVHRSKRSADGGTFDQALEAYNSLSRRRKSRFMSSGGRLPGVVCLVSSKRYPGEFTDRKQLEAEQERRERGSTSIYVYDRRIWDIKPVGTYGEARFRLFLGDTTRKPRILDSDAEVTTDDARLIIDVPEEFRSEFQRDMLSAIRDIAGSATFAIHPFIVNTEPVQSAFGCVASILNTTSTDFQSARPVIYPNRIDRPNEPRFAHVDLGLTGDSAGVAVGWVSEFIEVPRTNNTFDPLPSVVFDLILEVKPPRGGEIRFEDIRKLFLKLRELGMNLKWITYDSFQSADSLQLLHQAGFTTGTRSIDRESEPYDVMKTAFYDRRVSAPAHEKAMEEIVRLERNPQTGRIDHPPHFSKDCADAVAGVIHGLTYRRETWSRYKVPTRRAIENIIIKSERSLCHQARGDQPFSQPIL